MAFLALIGVEVPGFPLDGANFARADRATERRELESESLVGDRAFGFAVVTEVLDAVADAAERGDGGPDE
jgi:hypothetical protein